jgi:type I site-specific restriction endonuclease
MAEERSNNYELGRLILEYLRVFMWPMVLLIIVLIYWEDFFALVRDREVNVFGLEIGPTVERIQRVEAATQQELQDIAVLVRTLQENYEQDLEAAIEQLRAGEATAALPDIETKLSSLRDNLDREVLQIQQVAAQQPRQQQTAIPPPADTRAERAAMLERRGLEAILSHNLDAALQAFTEARVVWPDYHNVAEIQRYLAQLKQAGSLTNEREWIAVERTLLTEYSWGIPADLRSELRRRVDAAAYEAKGGP